jgi:hypothetical protein
MHIFCGGFHLIIKNNKKHTMKMFVVTSIKEDLQNVAHIFEEAQIPVFSVSDTIGHKAAQDNYLLNNWFARSDAATSALFFFSFTDDDKAYKALALVKEYNLNKPGNFPVRAFILPVEGCSY